MTPVVTPTTDRNDVASVWHRAWHGPAVDGDLLTSVDLRASRIRAHRLPYAHRCALSVLALLRTEPHDPLASAAERTGMVVGIHWLCDDGSTRFARMVVARQHGDSAVGAFAHVGGSALFHYGAKHFGIEGYATCLVDASEFAQTERAGRSVVATGLADAVVVIKLAARLDVMPDARGCAHLPAVEAVDAEVFAAP
jgi:hypothetical protein